MDNLFPKKNQQTIATKAPNTKYNKKYSINLLFSK